MVGVNSSDSRGSAFEDRFFPYGDSLHATSSLTGVADRRDISVFMHVARYLGVGSRIAFYLEAGPTVRWTSEEFGRTYSYPAPRGTYAYADDRDSWNYGVDAQGGFEWFFRPRLSLSARYGVSAVRTETEETHAYDFYNPNDGYWDRRHEDIRSEGFSVQTTSTVLSLVAYW